MILGTYESPLGKMLIAGTATTLHGVWFCGQVKFAAGIEQAALNQQLKPAHQQPALMPVTGWLDDYFAGGSPQLTLPLATVGTPFQRDVWTIVRTIPYGHTITYGDIVVELQRNFRRKASAQAVGGAVGSNPFLLVVPCHRVVGANGSLTGYAGGLERKQALLDLEGARR